VGGAPPGVVTRHGPSGEPVGCVAVGVPSLKLATAATVANERGSRFTFRRRSIVRFAAALSAALVRGNETPVALLVGATASVRTVVRRPPSNAVTRGLEPSSRRGAPSVTRRWEARNCSAPPVRSATASPAVSGSVSLRPLRVALPVVRTFTPRASSFAVTVSVSEPDVSACAGGASTPSTSTASAQRLIAPGPRS
jgi:hypothetical protein